MRRSVVWSGLTAVLAGTLLFGVPGEARGQQGTVIGRVTDAASQQPLVGAQVFLPGTSLNSITNQDGRYVLPGAPVGQRTVRAVLIGYSGGEQTVTVTIGAAVTADFTLQVSAVELDAVVVNAVTGQRERRRAIGTNVASIQAAELDLAPITTISDVITGRVAGVTLQSAAGSLGTAQRIRIRGANSVSLSNEPLIFVDGVQISTSLRSMGVGGQETSRFNDIDPTDVERVEILKGPAASALYGTAAANGVILITTKRGRSGDANWTAYVETASITDETDYRANYFPYQLNTPGAPLFDADGEFDAAARSACYNFQAGEGLCAQDSVFVLNGMLDPRTRPLVDGSSQRVGMSVGGGGDRVTYYLSGDYESSNGVVSFEEQTKVNLRANLNAQIRDDVHAALTLGYTDNYLSRNSNDNSIFSPLINGLLGSAVYFPPEADGSTNFRNYGFQFTPEDLAFLPTEQEVDRFIMGLNTTYTPLSWLLANVNFGMDLVDQHDFDTLQPDKLPIAQSFAIGFRDSERGNTYNYTGRSSVAATFEPLDRLVSTTTLGGSYHREFFRSTFGSGAGIVPGTEDLGAASTLFEVDEDFEEVITIGALVRQQLAYKNRYFLSGSLRGDDNSAFGTDFGFAIYPAVDASWVVAEEDWFPQNEYIGDLRVRAAFGKSGSRPDFRDALTYYQPIAVALDGDNTSGLTLDNTGNVDLEPEKVTEYEVGFDLGLLRNRVGVQFTYYTRKSDGALISKRLPPSLGLSTSVFDNIGSMSNKGTELAINALVLDTDDATLDLIFTNTTLDNEIVELAGNGEDIILNRGEQRHRKGYPAGSFFQPRIIIDDANGDGLLGRDEVSTTGDVEFIGPPLPTNTQGLSAHLTLFRYISLSTLFERRAGNYQLDGTESFKCGSSSEDLVNGCYAMSVATAPLVDQAAFIGDRFLGTAYGFIYPADFIKWREMSITLSPPDALADRIAAFRGATLTLSGRNLATWTDYPGIDPEVNEQGASTNFNQNEFNTQPPTRYLTARLTFRF